MSFLIQMVGLQGLSRDMEYPHKSFLAKVPVLILSWFQMVVKKLLVLFKLVFNIDETGLFYRRLPDRSLITTGVTKDVKKIKWREKKSKIE